MTVEITEHKLPQNINLREHTGFGRPVVDCKMTSMLSINQLQKPEQSRKELGLEKVGKMYGK